MLIVAPSTEQRLTELMRDPSGYYARARARAFAEATRDVAEELTARAQQRSARR